MALILVTGSTTGLGLGAAEALIEAGHDVVLHARNQARGESLPRSVSDAAGLVIGDLAEPDEVAALVGQIDRFGAFDAVIHNAGVYLVSGRSPNARGQSSVLAVNVLAPYVLTARMQRSLRLIYLSSGMHRSGTATLDDIDWERRRWNATQAYCDSKLLVTALAMAVARHWREVRSNAVDPGWVPTRMGGAGAPDDLVLGHRTQVWLAGGDDADVSGAYWFHREQQDPAPITRDVQFQEALLVRLAELTGVALE